MTTVITEPDTEPDTEQVAEQDSEQDSEQTHYNLAALVAVILATEASAAAAEEQVTTVRTQMRQWYAAFTKDSWEYAEKAAHCSVWERCAQEAGIPGRPVRESVYVTGTVIVPMTATRIRAALGSTLTTAQCQQMIDALPECERNTLYPDTRWNLRPSATSVALSDDWDPLTKKSWKTAMCICQGVVDAFTSRARENYNQEATVQDVRTAACMASHHVIEGVAQ